MIRAYTMPRRKEQADNWEKSAAFVGIDYHKRSSVVTVGSRDGAILQQVRLSNDQETITKFFQRLPQETQCAVEACRGYEWLLDLLTDLGLKVSVANAKAVKLIAETRCKTDKVDSAILMELLCKGFLPTCYQAKAAERSLRERLRWRVQLVRTSTKYKNMLHALIDKENKSISNPFTAKGRKALKELKLDDCREELLGEHLDVIDFFNDRLERESSWIKTVAAELPEAQLLGTIPGVGGIVSLMFIAEVGDIARFRNASSVAAFLGLVPSVYSSGEKYRTGRITKQGCGLLRWLLIQSAWQAIRSVDGLRQRFNKISRRTGKRKAIVAIARKLAEICYRVLRDKKPFDERRWALG